MRQSFFTELKRIGNQAGISMHDPGGIDLSEAGNAVNSGFRWWHQKAAFCGASAGREDDD